MKKETKLLHVGRNPEDHHGIVNPPVYHASTITFPTVAALEKASANPFEGVYYGLTGTPTTFALQEAVAELEGYPHAVAVPSGLAAITAALMAFLKTGEHLLMVDSVYGPTRRFCDDVLARFGVETTYYDPMIGAGIAELMRPETRVVFTESPGSLTFEVQDIPAIAAAAHAGGAKVVIDDTWSAGLYMQPAALGCDVAVQALTKYVGGHSDLLLGAITMCGADNVTVRNSVRALGMGAAPDDCFMALRGLRSMASRMPRHQQTGLELARWLAARPEVERVLHPALPSCPGHEFFKRDFSGSSGLFSFVLKKNFGGAAVAAMLDGMELFPMGYSWGGYESLMVPYGTHPARVAVPWTDGELIRVHAGLEDASDLIADLEKGFARLNGAA